MSMRLHSHLIILLGAAIGCAAGPALADGDVTMTVIPSGGDVVKTVVQNITVPADADKVAKAPHKAPAADRDNDADRQTQQQVQQQALQAQIAASKAKPLSPPPPPPRPPRR